MKYLAMVKSFFLHSITGKIIIAVELLIGLLILFYTTDRLTVFQQEESYTARFANVACYMSDDSTAEAYAAQNGSLLGPVSQLQIIKDDGSGMNGIFACLASPEYYRQIPLDLFEGNWFYDNESADLIAVIPYSLRGKWSCGNIYTISFFDIGKKDVYVSGVLSSDVTLGNSGTACFEDDNIVILLTDPSGKCIANPATSLYCYAILRNTDSSECESMGITTVGMMENIEKRARELKTAPLVFFTAALFILFTCGYIGECYLSLAERTKAIAVYYMCGSPRWVCYSIQLLADAIGLLIPFVVSIFIALIIGIRLRTTGIIIPLVYLFLGTFLIGLILLWNLSKQSPVQTIRKRYYS